MRPAITTTIGSCNVRLNGTQAFSYIGSDQRLYLMVQQGEPGSAWQTIDLISQWQSTVNVTPTFPRPATGPRSAPIAVNAFEAMAGFFIFYIDGNNHVQALPHPIQDTTYAPPGWPPGGSISAALYPDLTERTGAPPAASFSGVASYAWESQKSQHVVYVGEDGNVWELYWMVGQYDQKRGGPSWQSNNLSARTGFTGVLAPKQNGSIAATMFERAGSEHVIYLAGDSTIRELWFWNGEWGGNNLSEATGAKPPAVNSPLATFASNYEGTLHVVYLGQDGDLHELWWGNGEWQPDHIIGWGSNQLFEGLGQPATDTALAGYACEFEHSHHVIYIDVNNNIQELYHTSGGWGSTTLSSSAGSGATPPLTVASPLAGNSDEGLQAQHVFYLDNETLRA